MLIFAIELKHYMEHQTVHDKCVRHTLEGKHYQEFDAKGDVVFSLKLKHDKSVTFKLSKTGGVVEYDEWDRMTFYKSSSGYWCLMFFDEPTNPDRVNITPYQVVHKWWNHYNDL